MNTIPNDTKLVITDFGVLSEVEVPNTLLNAERSVYEVIRLIEGKPLFIEDHFERLNVSANQRGFSLEFSLKEFKLKIAELSAVNTISNGNVKFVLNVADNKPYWMLMFIPHQYPDASNYEVGVPVGCLFAERENPSAKLIQNSLRDRANKMIKEENLYEILLVDKNGMITEGSRSNVFFVKGKVFFTAPSTMVLNGITRIKVLECLKKMGVEVREDAVNVNEMSRFDAACLTGTSPKVLPISRVGDIKFRTENLLVKNLITDYNLMIERYLSEQK